MSATKENDAQPRNRCPMLRQSKALGVVLREEFGVPFRFFDAVTGLPVGNPAQGDADNTSRPGDRDEVIRLATENRTQVKSLADGRHQLILPFQELDRTVLVAIGFMMPLARTESEVGIEQSRLRKWLQSFHDRLRLADRSFNLHRTEVAKEGQASLAWDAILGIEQLLSTLRIQIHPEKSARRILRVAADLLKTQAVVWVPREADTTIVIDGDPGLSPWDCGQLASLLAQSPDWQKAGFLICNDLHTGSWGARFPQVRNLLVIPILDRGKSGWIIAINKSDSSSAAPARRDAPRNRPGEQGETVKFQVVSPPEIVPFRRIDAALLTSFATLLGMQIRAASRYENLKQLMVGLTRSLTSAIDAKDAYTFGHSERVARIAVELGRELGLEDEELSDIYLAGLLHDIGKIGIRDAILCKRGPLTVEEFDHIKQHVTIGFRILADLRPIRNLLPGVLYHHEHYDGSGYPEGLKGDMIPFLARILAVADGYDAMSTSRPYRSALPSESVEEILTKGAGSQWDKAVIDAFFRCRTKIHAIRQRGVGESLCNALDGALRNADQSNARPNHIRLR